MFSMRSHTKTATLMAVMGVMAFPTFAKADPCNLNKDILNAVFENPQRTKDETSLDLHRRPDLVLDFWGIGTDAKIADMEAGAGYYTNILSAYLKDGHVTAVNSDFLVNDERFADRIQTIKKIAAAHDNVTRMEGRLDQIDLPDDLGGVMSVNFYHDTLWLGYDRKQMNKEIFDSLKSGGTYLVIDHEAPLRAGFTVGDTTHRVEASAVLKEVLESGFHLVKTGDMLIREDDVLTQSAVKLDERRGKTSRFVYLFQKP